MPTISFPSALPSDPRAFFEYLNILLLNSTTTSATSTAFTAVAPGVQFTVTGTGLPNTFNPVTGLIGSSGTITGFLAQTNQRVVIVQVTGLDVTLAAVKAATAAVKDGSNPLAILALFGAFDYVFQGKGNADVLMPGDPLSDNIIATMTGNNEFRLGAGNDSLTAGSGNDSIRGASGDDYLAGGAGNDSLFGDAGNDTLNGAAGNDSLVGGDGNDSLTGGMGDDTLLGGAGDDTILGGEGNDSALGGAGADSIAGGNGNDTLQGEAGNDTLQGGAGNDSLLGGDGSDLLFGGGGRDRLNGGSGNDTLHGDDGDDTLNGGGGGDLLFGGNGNDSMIGGAGNDTLNGGAGNDTLNGGPGTDVLTGDAGADTFVWLSASAMGLGVNRDRVTDFEIGVDFIDLSALNLTFIGGERFTGAGREVRFAVGGDGHGALLVDINGNKSPNGVIVLEGVTVYDGEGLIL